MPKTKSAVDFFGMKRRGGEITFLTANDFPTALFAESVRLVDMLVGGDSLGMCVEGYRGTVPVVMDQMIVHANAVYRGAPSTIVVGQEFCLS